MLIDRPWALWRQIQYGFGFLTVVTLIFWWIYFANFYTPSNCFDNKMNDGETGVDCGGDCVRICAVDVIPPKVLWAQSFKVTGDQYNALAYVENSNKVAATPEIDYTFLLYDERGEVIIERNGTTVLPPDSEYPIFEPRINTDGREVARTEVILGRAEIWQPATIGRDQFQVNERKLYSTDSRPRLEATIENTDLREANEVEIVATIFDSRGNALTSSRTFLDRFAGQSTQRAVFTWPEPIAKTVRSCEVPTDVALAIDLSGSMNNDGGEPPEPVTSVLSAAQAFTSRMQTGDQASLITFATDAVLNNTLTPSISQVSQAIGRLSISPTEETGSTNTGEAIRVAHRELISTRHNEEARKVLVLLTDGLATAPGQNPEDFALDAAKEIKSDGVTVYTIGLGEDVNMNFVRTLASSPSHAYQALTRSDIDRIYATITGDICEDGPAVIDIVPKTTASFTPLR